MMFLKWSDLGKTDEEKESPSLHPGGNSIAAGRETRLGFRAVIQVLGIQGPDPVSPPPSPATWPLAT